MTDLRRLMWRVGPVLLLALSAGATRLPAQAQRDSLVAKAVDEFDTGRQLELLRAALDPAAGPLTGSWSTGVQLLAQTLLQDKRDSLAATWLRWAARLSPSLKPDTVQFLPFVATALRSAQEFVRRSSTPGDSLAKTSWVWPARGTEDVTGKLQLSATGAIPPRMSITGTPITPGAPATLDPGSYEIRSAGEGYDSISVTREVLPAVTTVVELRPRSVLAQVAKPQPGPTPQPATPSMPPIELAKPHKKSSTLLIVGLGVVGAGVAVAALAGGGSKGGNPPPSTGGITLTFPNP